MNDGFDDLDLTALADDLAEGLSEQDLAQLQEQGEHSKKTSITQLTACSHDEV